MCKTVLNFKWAFLFIDLPLGNSSGLLKFFPRSLISGRLVSNCNVCLVAWDSRRAWRFIAMTYFAVSSRLGGSVQTMSCTSPVLHGAWGAQRGQEVIVGWEEPLLGCRSTSGEPARGLGAARRWQVIHLQNKGRFSGILRVFGRRNLHPSKDGLCQVTHPAPPAPNAQNFDPSLLFPHTSLPLALSLLLVPLHFFSSEDWGLWPELPKGGQGGHSAPGTPAAPGQTGACQRA